MLTKEQEQYYVKAAQNLNAIAKVFGGWKVEQHESVIRSKIAWLRLNEIQLNQLCLDAVNGGSRDLDSETRNKIAKSARRQITQRKHKITNIMLDWFVKDSKFEKSFFVNEDPRGYALKLKLTPEERKGIFTDWGGYGLLAPEQFNN